MKHFTENIFCSIRRVSCSIRHISTLSILLLYAPSLLFAQEQRSGISHRIYAGINLGAASPIPISNRFSDFSWSPRLSPSIGWASTFMGSDKFGLTTGIRFEQKSMKVEASVYQLYTQLTISMLKVEGYFTGRNLTTTRVNYLTIPLTATYRPDEKWNIDAGVFGSLNLGGSFKGGVRDGYFRIETPVGVKTDIDYESFEFNDKINSFDYGVCAGFERRISGKTSAVFNLQWSLASLLQRDFKGLDYKLHNIFGFIGISYTIK